MQSIRARFNGNVQEVVEFTRLWGRHEAMDRYKVKDYIAFSKFIESETGDPNFGINPKLNHSPGLPTAEDLLDAFVHKLEKERDKFQDQISSLRAELDQLKLENEYLKAQESNRLTPKLVKVMEMCE